MQKVIIADNSAIFKGFIKDILEKNNEYKIIKMTANGEEVIKTHDREFADIIIIGEDISLINEMETAKLIMQNNPTCVILLSNKKSAKDLTPAYNYGISSIIKKPDIDEIQNKDFAMQFIDQIKKSISGNKNNASIMSSLRNKYKSVNIQTNNSKRIIVMGASTGGPKTIQKIFSEMPADFPIGIALVQHFEEGFEQGFVDWLNNSSALSIRLAKEKDFPQPGEVIIAPQGLHMKADGSYIILSDGAKVNNQKPAVDVLFTSAAKIYKESLIGVLLTGMGRDGADGCLDIVNNGGFTVVQDKESSIVYGMPKEAVNLNAASVIMPYTEIASYLQKIVKERM